jgi:hypothetical protein
VIYDSDRGKIVLFGGGDYASLMNYTWEWDGNEWTQIADTGPSSRAYHSMVYESQKKRHFFLEALTLHPHF